MTASRLRTLASLCAGALALCGCAGSYQHAVDETRAKMIGLTGRELRQCLGVPTDFDREDEVEFLTYRWVLERDRAGTAHVGSGGVGGIVIGRQAAAMTRSASRASSTRRRSVSCASSSRRVA